MKEFIKKLAKIQKELKAGKSQFNKFGNYYHRNVEDILEALKPHLGEMSVNIDEEMIVLNGIEGSRFYVKSTATITDGEFSQSSTAFAREPEMLKGMSEPQVTGTSSSYASKYALGKLFLLDDTKDADTNEVTQTIKGEQKSSPKFARKSSVKESEPEVENTPTTEAQPEEPTTTAPTRRSFRRK